MLLEWTQDHIHASMCVSATWAVIKQSRLRVEEINYIIFILPWWDNWVCNLPIAFRGASTNRSVQFSYARGKVLWQSFANTNWFPREPQVPLNLFLYEFICRVAIRPSLPSNIILSSDTFVRIDLVMYALIWMLHLLSWTSLSTC